MAVTRAYRVFVCRCMPPLSISIVARPGDMAGTIIVSEAGMIAGTY